MVSVEEQGCPLCGGWRVLLQMWWWWLEGSVACGGGGLWKKQNREDNSFGFDKIALLFFGKMTKLSLCMYCIKNKCVTISFLIHRILYIKTQSISKTSLAPKLAMISSKSIFNIRVSKIVS
jgi:hypothetical protein